MWLPGLAIKKVKDEMNRKKAIRKDINPRKKKHKKNQEEWGLSHMSTHSGRKYNVYSPNTG